MMRGGGSLEHDDPEGLEVLRLCEEGRADELKTRVRARPYLCSFGDRRGRTALLCAACSPGCTAVLLAAGADPQTHGRGGWTPLHAACHAAQPLVVKELLGAGALCNSLNDDGNTALHYAVRKPAIGEEVLAVLVSRCSDVNVRNKTGETALFVACWRQNEMAVELLLRCQALLLPNTKGQTPLHIAAIGQNQRICEILLAKSPAAQPLLLHKDENGKIPADFFPAFLKGPTDRLLKENALVEWLKQIGVDPKFHQVLLKEEFDLQSVALVTEPVLASLGLPLAVRLTVLHNAKLIGGSLGERKSLSGSVYSGRFDTTSDLEEEVTGGEEGFNMAKLRDGLIQRNVPVLDFADLQMRHVIGSGFFSEVRLAEWSGVNVAVKSIKEQQPNRLKNQLEIFLQEVGIMARLRHPNVVQFLGVSLQNSFFCILTEYMAGGTLFAAMREPTWKSDSERRFFKIACDICKGMNYLHVTAGVIHRDLTSKNVLLDSIGTAKIADFGVSRLDNPDYLTHPVGALPYVAPEVYLHHKYSFFADIYSFAIIMCECLTGDDILGTFKPREMAEAVAHKNYRPKLPQPDEDSWFDQSLLELISRCWDQVPENRPDFREVLNSLENLNTQTADAGYVMEKGEL